MRSRYMVRAFGKSSPPFLLEADVLKRFGSRPVQLGRPFVIPPSSCQIAPRNPSARW